MANEEDVLAVAWRVGEAIMVEAKGDPARTVAYGAAAVVAVAGTLVVYGGYVYSKRAVHWLLQEV